MLDTRARLIEAMIAFYKGNKRDIAHFLKVFAYAQTIADLEGLDAQTKRITELAAIVHDIACPLCREKYGSASGDLQERESESLLIPFLQAFDLSEAEKSRIIELVTHHHTTSVILGIDHQILLEADYLVNADEGRQPSEAIEAFERNVFRTVSGKRLLRSVYQEEIHEE